EEDGPPPAVAGALEVVQRQRRLHHVLRLDEHQLLLQHLAQHADLVPLGDDLLHVQVGGEERHDAVGRAARELDQQAPVVAHHR
ncbi:unnamed protein product, partial [Heterosigma akashiwo]